MADQEKFSAARGFFRQVSHSQALNMRLESMGRGEAVVSMPYDPRLIGDPETAVMHGGAISALLDTCGGVAVICHPDVDTGTATLTLTINYMRPAQPEHTVFAQARCYHVTRSVAFVHVSATDRQFEPPVAAASGAFTVG